ncbi:unnamed protein product [Scytosiphon promiscuus]
MTPGRPAAVVLTLVAGRATGFLHPPALPPPRGQTWFNGPGTRRASSHVPALPSSSAGLTSSSSGHRRYRSTAASNSKTYASRMLTRCSATQQCRLLAQQRQPAAADAGQSKSVRRLSTKMEMSAGQQQARGAGGPPAGGYPPPEHLHGVFAVYKPKGFSSANVVQKIKNVLTKGVREELEERIALERSMVASDTEEATTSGMEEDLSPPASAAVAVAAGGTVDGEASPRGGKGPEGENGGAEGEGLSKQSPKKKGGRRPRRQKGPKVKVGHGGTLDPMATGVLVIGVGKGCRELGNFLKGSKGYRAEALLGHETNTQDAEGEATLHGEWEHVTGEAVDGALGQFVGDIMQVPPMFSALHKDGERLYELARKGITVEREARPVTVYSLRQTSPALTLPLLGLELESGGGFYVRTLIEDLARALGTRAHMTALERTKQGPFELEHALPQAEWEYSQLCDHLGDEADMMDRLRRLTGEEDSEGTAPAVPATTLETAAASAATPAAVEG